MGTSKKCTFSVIAASAPYSSPHVLACTLRLSVRCFLALTEKSLFLEVPLYNINGRGGRIKAEILVKEGSHRCGPIFYGEETPWRLNAHFQ
jgi:hypothetical protein